MTELTYADLKRQQQLVQASRRPRASDRMQAATQEINKNVLNKIVGGANGRPDVGELLRCARASTHPMTSYVISKQARDYRDGHQFLFTGSKNDPQLIDQGVADSILAAVRNPFESHIEMQERLLWLWQVYGSAYICWLPDSSMPLGLAFHLASPLAVKRGTNPVTGKEAIGIQLASWQPHRWFDVTHDAEGNETCNAKRMWRPSRGMPDKPRSTIGENIQQYELYFHLYDADIAAALNMAVNNGLVWFYGDSTFDLADGGYGGDLGDQDDEDGVLESTTLDPQQAMQAKAYEAFVEQMSMRVPDLNSRIKSSSGSNVDLYMDAVDAVWKDPNIGLRRMPLPVVSVKPPQYIPVGRAYDDATMRRQRENQMEIARALDVPDGWAMRFVESAPATSESATLRDSREYREIMASMAADIDTALSEAVIGPICELMKLGSGVQLGRTISYPVDPVEAAKAARWAWENGFPTTEQFVADSLGMPLAVGQERLDALARVSKQAIASAPTRIAASTNLIDMPYSAITLLDRR
jgi:hypothetical protein